MDLDRYVPAALRRHLPGVDVDCPVVLGLSAVCVAVFLGNLVFPNLVGG
eukprot:CAMPEP_0204323136 /NCGR_PEP_ID=MMETSP0469-20131031/9172_1 /ASSEMBLY_ACC=CAM_ASM_000384 /TAXON_ID=2969 /ORGANISM="Oxyrrhis marina" /LENGTH=48 /DNA_ID= /DNA_START= /DNA_END= /DNA_ORIENTATION=